MAAPGICDGAVYRPHYRPQYCNGTGYTQAGMREGARRLEKQRGSRSQYGAMGKMKTLGVSGQRRELRRVNGHAGRLRAFSPDGDGGQ